MKLFLVDSVLCIGRKKINSSKLIKPRDFNLIPRYPPTVLKVFTFREVAWLASDEQGCELKALSEEQASGSRCWGWILLLVLGV